MNKEIDKRIKELEAEVEAAELESVKIHLTCEILRLMLDANKISETLALSENTLAAAEELVVGHQHTDSNDDEILRKKKIALSYALYITGNCHYAMGEYHIAYGYHQRAYTIGEETQYVHGAMLPLLHLARYYDANGKIAESLTSFERAKELAQSIGDNSVVAISLNGLGICHFGQSRFEEAIVHFKEAGKIFETLSDYEQFAGTLINTGGCYVRLGETQKAIASFHKGIKICHEKDKIPYLLNGLLGLSTIYQDMGLLDEAYSCNTESLSLALRLGIKDIQADIYISMGILDGIVGKFAEQGENFQKALSIATELDDKILTMHALTNLCPWHARQGEYNKSLHCAKEQQHIAVVLQSDYYMYHALINQGIALCGLEETTAGELMFSEALELANKLGLSDIYRVYFALGNVNERAGKFDRAIEYFHQALSTLDKSEIKTAQQETHQFLSDVYERTGDLKKALHHHKEYHRIEKEVFNEESDKRLKNLQIIHEVETMKKEAEILRLDNERMKTERNLQTKHLTSLTLNLVQQNEFLGSLRLDLLRLSEIAGEEIELPLKDLARRLRRQTQAQDEWSAFEEQFRLLHTDFMERLSKKYPGLSPTELRICALMKIGLVSKDISSLLCVTLRCVETHRYRIRKKTGVGAGENLSLLLNSI